MSVKIVFLFYMNQTPAQLTYSHFALQRATLINAFGSVKKQRALREMERNQTQKNSVTNAQVIDRAMHGQTKLKYDNEANSNNRKTCFITFCQTRFLTLFPVIYLRNFLFDSN